ncbi:MAG: hypothetical protein ACLPIX_22160 [Rhodomicrobium sp.]
MPSVSSTWPARQGVSLLLFANAARCAEADAIARFISEKTIVRPLIAPLFAYLALALFTQVSYAQKEPAQLALRTRPTRRS